MMNLEPTLPSVGTTLTATSCNLFHNTGTLISFNNDDGDSSYTIGTPGSQMNRYLGDRKKERLKAGSRSHILGHMAGQL